MAEYAAIQALSSIAAPADSSGRSEAPSGCASLWSWLEPGQLLEVSSPPASQAPGGFACSSVVARLVAQAQAQGEPVVWIDGALGPYPPDLAAVGVDLSALVVVCPPEGQARHEHVSRGSRSTRGCRSLSNPEKAVRAAEVLLRSGAFGLVVLDLSAAVPARSMTWLAKLHGLLRLHGARLVVLRTAHADAASLGPLVSLRVEPRCRRVSAERWVIEHTVLKNKQGREVRISPDVRVAPEGAASVWVGPALSMTNVLDAGCEGAQEHCA